VSQLKGIWSKLREKEASLGLLEAIEAFEQIRYLIAEEQEKCPWLAKESLLELYQLILTVIQEGHLGESEGEKIWRLLEVIEEDIYRIANNAKIDEKKYKEDEF
jgi:hypothetical protein